VSESGQLNRINIAYDSLLNRSDHEVSPLGRISLILDFFRSFPTGVPESWKAPYLLELTPEILFEFKRLGTFSLPFESLLEIKNIISNFTAIASEEGRIKTASALASLRRELAFIYLCLHEYDNCLNSISQASFETGIHRKVKNSSHSPILKDLTGFFEGTPLEWLEEAARIIPPDQQNMHTIIDDFRSRWKNFTGSPVTNGIQILFVEKGQWHICGHIEKLTLAAKKISAGGDHDRIRFNNSIHSEGDPLVHQARDAVIAARKLLSESGEKNLLETSWDFSFSLPDKEHLYTGDSLGFAFGLLIATALYDQKNGRQKKNISRELTMTGALDLQGDCLPVDEVGLEAKIRKAFYSPVQVVAVPDENAGLSENFIRTLHDKHPGRQLDIVPLENLEKTMNDKKVVVTSKESLQPYISRKLRSSPGYLKAIAVTAGMAIILSVVLNLFRSPAIPVTLDLVEKYLIAYNFDGKAIWEYNMGYLPGSDLEFCYENERYIIEDMDGDGQEEIAAFSGNCDSGLLLELLVLGCDGRRIDSFPISKNLDGFDECFVPRRIFAVDYDGNGTNELLTISNHHKREPCLVHLISLEEGILGEYTQMGYINAVAFKDIDEDDDLETLIGGTNNEYKQAVLLVFDTGKISGISPGVSDNNYCRGSEKFFLRLPRSYLCPKTENPSINEIRLLSDDLILAVVQEGKGDAGNNLQVFFYLDNEMNIVNILYPDEFLREVAASEKPRIPAQSSQFLSEGVSYWNGDEWITSSLKTD